jgi:DNA-binding transcriptional LysR family regulator
VDEYYALLPKAFRDGGRAGISLRELAKMPLLTLSSSTLFRNHLDSVLKENDLVAEHNYEFTHVSTLIAMAEAGLGIAILPRIAIPRKTPLKAVRVTGPALSRTIAVITIRGHSLSPAAARLVDLFDQLLSAPAK